jgi:ATP-dependent Clp protease, protease subunit
MMAKKTIPGPSMEYLAATIGYVAGFVTGVLVMTAMFSTEADAAGPKTIVLHDNNTVTLRLPMTSETITPVQKELIKKARNGAKEIYLVLNSPGGSIASGKLLIDTANALGVKVHTISMFSASMSFITSQGLGQRYALPSSTIMSHRAFAGGLEGQVPGSLLSQVNGLMADVWEIEEMVSARSGMSHDTYSNLIRDELWMTGNLAKKMGFMDDVVHIKCAKSLDGDADPIELKMMIFELSVVFPKCPLLEQPSSVSAADGRNTKESFRLYNKFIEASAPASVLSRWKAQINASFK